MNKTIVIIKKELTDQIRSYRFFIFSIILLIFAISSPVLAKMMPEIFKSMGDQLQIQIPTPTYVDAYAQFFKNLSQMGTLVILLIFAGIVCDEKVKGSATMILTKNVSRTTFVVGKFLTAALIWTAVYLVSALICIGYAYYFFPVAPHGSLLLANVMFWLYGLLIISITLFASTISNSHATATIYSFLSWIILLITSAIPRVQKYSPSLLGAVNTEVVAGTKTLSDVYIAIILASLLIITFVILSARSLSRQEL